VSVVARVVLPISILTLIICVLFGPRSQSAHRAPLAVAATPVAQWTIDDENGSVARHRDGEGSVDLQGNEVTDAVAKYELDATGDLYELHSPQTELPRLKSPKS
jgi:hypothetical protein